jgi:hypothetical protein
VVAINTPNDLLGEPAHSPILAGRNPGAALVVAIPGMEDLTVERKTPTIVLRPEAKDFTTPRPIFPPARDRSIEAGAFRRSRDRGDAATSEGAPDGSALSIRRALEDPRCTLFPNGAYVPPPARASSGAGGRIAG